MADAAGESRASGDEGGDEEAGRGRGRTQGFPVRCLRRTDHTLRG